MLELLPEVDEPPDRALRGSLLGSASWATRDLGVGFFDSVRAGDSGWVSETTFPIYDAPSGDHLGWVSRGWVLRDSEPTPWMVHGFVETDYEAPSGIVYEWRVDGWFRIRLNDSPNDMESMAWVHACRLDYGTTSLEVTFWHDHFEPGFTPLFMRERRERSEPLRAVPDGPVIAWVVHGDEMEVLGIEGPWMQVRLYKPGPWSEVCSGSDPESWEGETHEGWILWWSDENGSRVYWHTRGC